MAHYEVICGNVGKVYDGVDPLEANDAYDSYVVESKGGIGRAAHESVVLMEDGEPIAEYDPSEPYKDADGVWHNLPF